MNEVKISYTKYFQKICPMQKANGLSLKMCGARYNSMMSGMVLGYSCHPKTIYKYEKALADANKKETEKDHGSYSSKDHHVLDNRVYNFLNL